MPKKKTPKSVQRRQERQQQQRQEEQFEVAQEMQPYPQGSVNWEVSRRVERREPTGRAAGAQAAVPAPTQT